MGSDAFSVMFGNASNWLLVATLRLILPHSSVMPKVGVLSSIWPYCRIQKYPLLPTGTAWVLLIVLSLLVMVTESPALVSQNAWTQPSAARSTASAWMFERRLAEPISSVRMF